MSTSPASARHIFPVFFTGAPKTEKMLPRPGPAAIAVIASQHRCVLCCTGRSYTVSLWNSELSDRSKSECIPEFRDITASLEGG
jgi:hypothetical protein